MATSETLSPLPTLTNRITGLTLHWEKLIMLYACKDLKNFRLRATDGEIGRVQDFYLDDEHWAVRYLVADKGNWLPLREVLISPFGLDHVEEDKKEIVVRLSRQQIEESPPLETDKPVSRQFEFDYYRFYGWPLYWVGPALWGATAYPVAPVQDFAPIPEREPAVAQRPDPHLRSAKEIQGYRLEARDGEIGHAEDFLIDDSNWKVRYLVVDTTNWWPGGHVLLSPQWIERLSWREAKVYVDLTRDVIKGAPEYKKSEPITREYESRLYAYYRREGYWAQEVEPASRS